MITLLILTALIVLPTAATVYLVRMDRPNTRPATSHRVDPDSVPPAQRLSYQR